MLDTYKTIVVRQYEAALCTLNACVERCPPAVWAGRVGALRYSQAAFHALIFADLYLSRGVEALKAEAFHRGHADFFADYEEFEPRPPVRVYEKAPILAYVAHCRAKAAEAVAAETVETLNGPSGFGWLRFNRAELHVYNIRHVQHHAAQLSLRLRLETTEGVPWVSTGWREFPPADAPVASPPAGA